MRKPLIKFIFFGLFTIFVISSTITVLILDTINAGKYLGFEAKQGAFIETIVYIFWTLVLTISASPVYLNLNNSIRNIPLFSFLSFFALPMLLIITTFISVDRNNKSDSLYISTIVFLLTLASFYASFIIVHNRKN